MKNNKYKLYFDTSNRQSVKIKLFLNGDLVAEKSQLHLLTSQILLILIEKVLQNNGLTVRQISEIEFNPGPGSYTGLKIGAAVGNTLGWLLNIPVNGKKKTIALPVYQ